MSEEQRGPGEGAAWRSLSDAHLRGDLRVQNPLYKKVDPVSVQFAFATSDYNVNLYVAAYEKSLRAREQNDVQVGRDRQSSISNNAGSPPEPVPQPVLRPRGPGATIVDHAVFRDKARKSEHAQARQTEKSNPARTNKDERFEQLRKAALQEAMAARRELLASDANLHDRRAEVDILNGYSQPLDAEQVLRRGQKIKSDVQSIREHANSVFARSEQAFRRVEPQLSDRKHSPDRSQRER